MKLGVRLTALATVILSAAGVGVTTQSAEAVPVIIGARVCNTTDHYNFVPRLGITPQLAGVLNADYTATCDVQAGVTLTPPYLVTSARTTYTSGQTYNLIGDCVLAVLTGGTATVGGGILVGGIVSVTAGSSLGTFNNVAVKVLLPETATGSDICSEADANGLGVTVGTVNDV